MRPFLALLVLLAFLLYTAFGICKPNTKMCVKLNRAPCTNQTTHPSRYGCGSCLSGYTSKTPSTDSPCFISCTVTDAQCTAAHRVNCTRFLQGICGDCVTGYVGLEGPAGPTWSNATCVKSNDPPAINEIITQLLLAYDCNAATADKAAFKATLKAEFCSAMTQEDCDRLVFGDPKCASSSHSAASITAAEVSSAISIQDTNTDTIAPMTVTASGDADSLSAKAIVLSIDASMSDPTSQLMEGALMSTADTSTSLISKASVVVTYRCKGGKLTTNTATCPNRKTTTTLSVSTLEPVYGQTIILNVTIGIKAGAGASPAGQVIFKNNNHPIGSPVSVNIATKRAILLYKVTTIGSNSISAKYIEDDQFYGSNSIPKIVTVATAWTKINVTSSKNPSVHGQAITLTFTVAPTLAVITAIPTGKVRVSVDENFLQSVTLGAKGIATLSVSTLATGTHKITAQYMGDTHFKKSTTKTALSQVVT